jgi:hypothetical protein
MMIQSAPLYRESPPLYCPRLKNLKKATDILFMKIFSQYSSFIPSLMAASFFRQPSPFILTSVLIMMILTPLDSWSLNGNFVFEFGGFTISEGKNQNIGIQDLVGNTYTENGSDLGLILGAGYLFHGPQNRLFSIDYGLNAFYLGLTSVDGSILQEQVFENLSYSYQVTNIPIYATTKFNIQTHSDAYHVTLDAGIGPNFVITHDYEETSLDGVTVPDNLFSGHTQTNLSGMIGMGLRMENAFGHTPLECGYHFFYLGAGYLNKNNGLVLNNLETRNGYAHALTCSVIL